MNDTQRAQLQTILEETWMRIHSADEAFDMIEDIIDAAIESAVRMVE